MSESGEKTDLTRPKDYAASPQQADSPRRLSHVGFGPFSTRVHRSKLPPSLR